MGEIIRLGLAVTKGTLKIYVSRDASGALRKIFCLHVSSDDGKTSMSRISVRLSFDSRNSRITDKGLWFCLLYPLDGLRKVNRNELTGACSR